ncbi:ABC transporter ATP-binding protein [Desulfogranum marinum]|uniref:ABC transporter ATP-binding protein n=1 Tax=Desulfogranum marinum TaxID=453220 RepID=UPI0019656352|nr:ABC transporter ATP-binding protein [Desulfogranum marinum]MBM9512486.1 ABC transporter ATP-binding protein [Desulfogranum marinum]
MIRINQLTYQFPNFTLGPIDLHIEQQEFFILLGPTGSGKTVILESIAGLQKPHSGDIFLFGKDVTRVAPENRQVGIVYQDQALFPHLTVQENIEFGLRYQKNKTKASKAVLAGIIDTLGLARHLKKSTTKLSGGEKQRVALARALAIQPQVLLLDEPLSAIDPCFRSDIQRLLRQLHETLPTTFLMVTHDFNEAFYLADTVGVISKGILEQTGTVEEVFQRPKNKAVGEFVGMQNIFTPQREGRSLYFAGLRIDAEKTSEGRNVGLRPEDITVGTTHSFPDGFMVGRGILQSMTLQGFGCEMTIDCEGSTFLVHGDKGNIRDKGLTIGEQIYLGFHPDAVHYF